VNYNIGMKKGIFILLIGTLLSQQINNEKIFKYLDKIEKISSELPDIKKDSVKILIQKIKEMLKPENFGKEISEIELQKIIERIKNIPIADDALRELRKLTDDKYFTVSQAKKIMEIFHFKEDKREVFRILKNKIIDRKNLSELEKEVK